MYSSFFSNNLLAAIPTTIWLIYCLQQFGYFTALTVMINLSIQITRPIATALLSFASLFSHVQITVLLSPHPTLSFPTVYTIIQAVHDCQPFSAFNWPHLYFFSPPKRAIDAWYGAHTEWMPDTNQSMVLQCEKLPWFHLLHLQDQHINVLQWALSSNGITFETHKSLETLTYQLYYSYQCTWVISSVRI